MKELLLSDKTELKFRGVYIVNNIMAANKEIATKVNIEKYASFYTNSAPIYITIGPSYTNRPPPYTNSPPSYTNSPPSYINCVPPTPIVLPPTQSAPSYSNSAPSYLNKAFMRNYLAVNGINACIFPSL